MRYLWLHGYEALMTYALCPQYDPRNHNSPQSKPKTALGLIKNLVALGVDINACKEGDVSPLARFLLEMQDFYDKAKLPPDSLHKGDCASFIVQLVENGAKITSNGNYPLARKACDILDTPGPYDHLLKNARIAMRKLLAEAECRYIDERTHVARGNSPGRRM